MSRAGAAARIGARRLVLVAALIVGLAAGCTGDGVAPSTTLIGTEPSTTVSTTTTTTIDVTRACAVLGAETVSWLEELVHELDRHPLAQVMDPQGRPPELVDLQERGRELDRLAVQLGCDPGSIQAGVLQEAAGMEADGPIGAHLLELLSRAGG